MLNETNYIFELLDARRLKEALVQLEAICSQAEDWQLRNRIETIQTSYSYMLQYAGEGVYDPNRTEIYNHLLRNAYILTEWADIILQLPHTTGVYYEHLRTFKQHPPHSYPEIQTQLEAFTEDLNTLSLMFSDNKSEENEKKRIYQRHETAVNELFNKTWTSIQWSEAEMSEAQDFIHSAWISSNDKAVFISAITLSLMQIFDERKCQFLILAYKHKDLQVSIRSLIGLVFLVDKYEQRISLYPNIQSQLVLLHDDSQFATHLYNIQMQLLMTMETERVTKKMHEDIIPSIMKNAKVNEGKIRFNENGEEEDLNPEWDNWMDQSGVSEKIKEMGDLQMEGADVYMGTFAMLKDFPFFNQVSHWFYPFHLHHADLLPLEMTSKHSGFSPFSIILHSDTFCNSDKYSFSLSMLQMPENVREQTLQQLMNQSEMNEEQKSSIEKMMNRTPSGKSISRLYIQDLYRFAKIWCKKHPKQVGNLFASDFKLWNNSLLSASLADEQQIKGIADFLFQKKRYSSASELYEKLLEDYHETSEIYQKIGYIHQKNKSFNLAIKYYERADILNADNVWTLRHLAYCHKQNGTYAQALEFYKKLETTSPEDLSIATHIGECYLKMNEYEQALNYFFKVEFLSPNPNHARRAIAWCYFCLDKADSATKYYSQLLKDDHPQKQDWLNMGHVYLTHGKTSKALKYYSKAKEYYKEHTDFIEWFKEDIPYLKQFGVTEEDIQITLDLLI